MSSILKIFQVLALAALVVVFGEVAWTVHRVRPKMEVTISNIDRTVIIAGAAATHLEKAAGTWQQASKAQALETSQAMSNVSAAAGQLITFISKTDDSINSRLLPALTTSIEQQNASLLETQKELRENLSQMGQATAQLQQTLAAADAQISNPAIQESIANLAAATQNANHGMEQLAAIATDGRQVADKARETYLKPVNLWWNLVKTLLPLAGSAAQVVK
jgi:hypothetical protein